MQSYEQFVGTDEVIDAPCCETPSSKEWFQFDGSMHRPHRENDLPDTVSAGGMMWWEGGSPVRDRGELVPYWVGSDGAVSFYEGEFLWDDEKGEFFDFVSPGEHQADVRYQGVKYSVPLWMVEAHPSLLT